MSISKKSIAVTSVIGIFALGVGLAIGTSLNKQSSYLADSVNNNNNSIPVSNGGAELGDKSPEELSVKLSAYMMPEDEFSRLEDAIFQTAMGLFMAQAQGAGVNVTDASQQELRKTIQEKYSRKYFADMNAGSMKELTKPELIAILSFYGTTAGQKFLELSPKIIQSTMSSVQADLSAWLPKTVDALVAKLKNTGNGNGPNGNAPADKENS